MTDCFLYIISFLPLRIFMALVQCLSNPFTIITKLKKLAEPSHMIDFCKLFLIINCCVTLTFIDTSMIYHIIRAQTIIKLYIFYNMLEVADRLLCSIGQDILDALFWTIIEPKRHRLLILPHLFFASIYVCKYINKHLLAVYFYLKLFFFESYAFHGYALLCDNLECCLQFP